MTSDASQPRNESSPQRISATSSTNATTIIVVCTVSCRVGHTTLRISVRDALDQRPERRALRRLQGHPAGHRRNGDDRQHAIQQGLVGVVAVADNRHGHQHTVTTSHFRPSKRLAGASALIPLPYPLPESLVQLSRHRGCRSHIFPRRGDFPCHAMRHAFRLRRTTCLNGRPGGT
jgi:hypothetical protein